MGLLDLQLALAAGQRCARPRSWAAGAPTLAPAKDLPLQELAKNHATHPAPGGVACTGAKAHQWLFDACSLGAFSVEAVRPGV